jgi:hypothetical protein
MKKIFNKTIALLMTAHIKTVVYRLVLIPFLFLVFGMYVLYQYFDGNIPVFYNSVALSVMMFFLGLSSLVQVLRKESPGIMGMEIKGLYPVAVGLFGVVLGWSLACLTMYIAIASIL